MDQLITCLVHRKVHWTPSNHLYFKSKETFTFFKTPFFFFSHCPIFSVSALCTSSFNYFEKKYGGSLWCVVRWLSKLMNDCPDDWPIERLIYWVADLLKYWLIDGVGDWLNHRPGQRLTDQMPGWICDSPTDRLTIGLNDRWPCWLILLVGEDF